MLRRSFVGLAVLLLCGGFVFAETFTGKIEKLDADKKMGSVKDDKGTHPFKVNADTKIVDAEGKELTGGLGALKVGDDVAVTIDGKGKKAMTKEIKRVKKPDDKKENK